RDTRRAWCGPWSTSWLLLSCMHRTRAAGREIHPLFCKRWSERACREILRALLGRRRVRGAVLAEQRVEQLLQGAAAAQDARFHRAHAAFQHFGDLLVAQPFQIAEDDRPAKHLRYPGQRALDHRLDLAGSQLVEGRGLEILDLDPGVPFLGLSVE